MLIVAQEFNILHTSGNKLKFSILKQKAVLWDVIPCSLAATYQLLSSGKTVIREEKRGYRGREEIKGTTLKKEAVCSSEKQVISCRITRRHIPEDSTLHVHCRENLLTCRIYKCLLLDSTPIHSKENSALLFRLLQMRNVAKLILVSCPAAFSYLNIMTEERLSKYKSC
jgi:hypothetical protein